MQDNRNYFLDIYRSFDREYKTHEDKTYEYLVNFSQIQIEPIHRWFYYQEGYSPQLVKKILGHLNLTNNNTFIFDPFAGSGTTLLTAKQLGLKSVGFEINPFSAFMIKAKTQSYSKNELSQLIKFEIPNYSPLPNIYQKYKVKIIENWFYSEKLEKVELLKGKICTIKNKKIRDLLFAGLLSIIEDVSNYRKGGNGLKKKRVNKDLDPFKEFRHKIFQIYQDINHGNGGYDPLIINDSCLNMEKYGIENIDISLFSPPYANCFDPFEVYKMELWVGEFVTSYEELRQKRKSALTSNLNADVTKEIEIIHRTDLLSEIINYLSKQNLWDKRIPKMLDTYFYDMFTLLNMLYKKTKKGGYCVIVVGNSAYGNLAIPTDIILSEIGENIGFSIKEIIVARKNETSSQQHAKLGKFDEYLRESLIVLKK